MVITRMPLRLLAAERVKKRTLMQNKQQRIIHFSLFTLSTASTSYTSFLHLETKYYPYNSIFLQSIHNS